MTDDIILDRISIHEIDYQLSTELVLIGHDYQDIQTRHVGHITWEEVGDKIIKTPTWIMPNKRPETAQALQELADELWLLGYRPDAARGSAGQLEAVTAHLRDMQRLVFDSPRKKR